MATIVGFLSSNDFMNDFQVTTPATPTPSKPSGRPRSGSPLAAATIRAQFETTRSLYCDPLINLSDVPSVLNVSIATVRKLIASGRIRSWRSSPRSHQKIRASELIRYLKSGDQESAVQS